MYSNVSWFMNCVRHGSSTTFETNSRYCRVGRQSLRCYTISTTFEIHPNHLSFFPCQMPIAPALYHVSTNWYFNDMRFARVITPFETVVNLDRRAAFSIKVGVYSPKLQTLCRLCCCTKTKNKSRQFYGGAQTKSFRLTKSPGTSHPGNCKFSPIH